MNSTIKRILPLLSLELLLQPELVKATSTAQISNGDSLYKAFDEAKLISRGHFSTILETALDDDLTLQHFAHGHDTDSVETKHHEGRKLRGQKNEMRQQPIQNNASLQNDAWRTMMQHGWELSKTVTGKQNEHSIEHRQLRSENSTASQISPSPLKSSGSLYPFLICSQYEGQTGNQRLQRIVRALDSSLEVTESAYNTDEESCFVVATTATSIEESYYKSPELMMGVTFSPLVDVVKVAPGTTSAIYNEDWIPQVIAMNNAKRSFLRSDDVVEDAVVWKRSIMVDFVPGDEADDAEEDDGAVMAEQVIGYVQKMATVGSGTSGPRKLKSENGMQQTNEESRDDNDSPGLMSIREAFSLTANVASFVESPRMSRTSNIWSKALEGGFEANHHCGEMFNELEVRSRGEPSSITGFEIILNAPAPSSEDDNEITLDPSLSPSAWNKNCVLSLVMGLSVHPHVRNVEVGQQLVLASTEGVSNPQWITQSAYVGKRPFFEKGLDGTGQIVAVADGGLDRDNCYFKDANAGTSIFDGWDNSQRKIVRYDDSFGDRKERSKGHGTYVSGIIAGRKALNGKTEVAGFADGSAPGAKLFFFDMEVGNNGIGDPGVSRLFSSFYNSGDGAYIMNGSWGRSYRGKYSSFCRDYDAALRKTYKDVLFVVSAGNTGREGESSIQNPADCKNSLAVGSSLNYGNDIRSKEKGIEYLADYSSRGPTRDGRMKPDIVAPGHFILAPNADPNSDGECDGNSSPSVRNSLDAGKGQRYVSGTSMASPVLAGTAAIVRQYFEEGYCTSKKCCGYKGCGESIKPSGALLKAVLLNGAQPLTGGIQYVPDGNILSDQPLSEYDNNQGMGRVNLLNSVPLEAENKIQLIAVNDDFIRDGAQETYNVKIDTSNGCNSDLSATLAWYDMPGSVGCTHCVVNDLDLYIQEVGSSKKLFPNGRNNIDTKNTVERIHTSVSDGQEFQIVVNARNLASTGQRYSLAISGCLADENQPSSESVTDENQPSSESAKSLASLLTCDKGKYLEVVINTAENGSLLSWNLAGGDGESGIKTIAQGPEPGVYGDFRSYPNKVCVLPGNKYRLQIKNSAGIGIQGKWGDGSYSVSYDGSMIFDSKYSSQDFDDVATHKFSINEDLTLTPLGRQPEQV